MDAANFGVRVGDDGRWHAKWLTLADARKHAHSLSSGGIGRAQVVEFPTGYRETWEDGKHVATRPGR